MCGNVAVILTRHVMSRGRDALAVEGGALVVGGANPYQPDHVLHTDPDRPQVHGVGWLLDESAARWFKLPSSTVV